MKKYCFRLALLCSLLVPVVCQTAFAAGGTFAPKKYILSTDQWGPAQTNAVARAGGRITFSHQQTGLAVVISDNPNFLNQMMASGTVTSGYENQIMQVKLPFEPGPPVTPGDESFINFQWNLRAINAPQAWATGVSGAGVRVAVLDGGIHSQHVDLDNNLDFARSRSFVHQWNEDGTISVIPWNDDVGTLWHGTHVAGIIAAEDNGFGTIGVAPRATIIGVKMMHGNFLDYAGTLEAIIYAATPVSEGGAGADIINMSWRLDYASHHKSAVIYDANKVLNFAHGKGVLLIAAAGNEGINWDQTPSDYLLPQMSDNVIAVGATSPTGFGVNYPNGATDFRNLTTYSNTGRRIVDLTGPGGQGRYPDGPLCSIPLANGSLVTRDCRTFDRVLSTDRGTTNSVYNWLSGTSMAAPAVAGVAALIKQRYPGISVDALENRLFNSVDDEGPRGTDPYYGRGFVNAYRAVTR